MKRKELKNPIRINLQNERIRVNVSPVKIESPYVKFAASEFVEPCLSNEGRGS